MNIFFSVNNAYTEQLLVAMISVVENNKADINFHILSNDFSEASKTKVNVLKNKYKNIGGVYYYFVDKSKFDGFRINADYITIETYYRFLIADLVPNIDKALYLDADLVINGNINDFYNTNLDGYYCAGIRDLYIERINHKGKIGLSPKDLYVNAGVLLFNLAKIRQDNMIYKLLDDGINLASKVSFADQDIINISFKDKIKEVDSIYNFTSANVGSEKGKRSKAVIIHCTGEKKPWQKTCKHRLKWIWKKYFRISQSIFTEKSKFF